MKNKLLYIILIIVIIVGVIVYKVKGFNKELNYSNRQEFEISAASTFDVSKVEEIVKSVITNRQIKVQKRGQLSCPLLFCTISGICARGSGYSILPYRHTYARRLLSYLL